MDNVTFIEVEQTDGSVAEFAVIDKGNGEFTSMLKSVYDEMIAAQASSIPAE